VDKGSRLEFILCKFQLWEFIFRHHGAVSDRAPSKIVTLPLINNEDSLIVKSE